MTDRRNFLRLTAANAAVGSFYAALNAARSQFASEVGNLALTVGSAIDFDELRQSFSLDPKINYLNHASIGAISIPVQKTREQYLRICEENPWLYMWGGEWEQPRENVRKLCANLIGCESNEVAITHNTTEIFNTLANGLPLEKADEVLFSSLNHSGASVAFEHAANRLGYSVRQFEFPLENSFELTPDRIVQIYAKQISSATRLLVFPHIDNTIGVRYPVERLAQIAKSKGVKYIAVDGAQSVGTIPVHVRDSGVDVYATSGHKWLGAPKGTGIGFVSHRIQQDLQPMWVTWGQSSWKGSARAYEDYGTRNFAEVLALGDAIEFHQQIENAAREKRIREIREHLYQRIAAIDSLEFNSPQIHEHGSAVISIGLSRGGAKQVAKQLFQTHQIVVRPFQSEKLNAIRVSPNVYTRLEEIDQIIELLRAI